MRPSCAFIFRPTKGVGNAGCPLHPRPRVHFVLVERTRVTTSTPESPGIPARNGFTAYVALSSVTGLFCHRRLRIKFCPSPVGPTPLRKLDASVGASGGWRELVEMICPTGEAKYFCKRDWTRESTNRPTGKSAGGAVATNQTRLGRELINASALADLRFGAHRALKSDIGRVFARPVGFAGRLMRP
jgi:hypothetical protein